MGFSQPINFWARLMLGFTNQGIILVLFQPPSLLLPLSVFTVLAASPTVLSTSVVCYHSNCVIGGCGGAVQADGEIRLTSLTWEDLGHGNTTKPSLKYTHCAFTECLHKSPSPPLRCKRETWLEIYCSKSFTSYCPKHAVLIIYLHSVSKQTLCEYYSKNT